MNHNKAVDYIMDNFDFYEVHETMKTLSWEWSTVGGVPSYSDLKETAKRLLTAVANGKTDYCATGGFVAEDYGGNLRLSFVLTEYTSEGLEDLCQ